MRNVTMLAMLALALSGTLLACDKDGGGSEGGEGGESGFTPDGALMALADAAETHAEVNGNLFAETGVMAYCRGGSTVQGSIFTDVGFQPPADTSWTYCFNVSGDRTRVALSVAESDMAGEVRCLITDYSSGEPVRSEITSASSCMP